MKFKLVCIGALMLGLSSCGFHVPNQNRLGSNISEIGFLISNKKAETFMLEIESIKIQ